MKMEQLNYLIDLQETHSMNASASKFFLSQPALSKAVATLEGELGHMLLNRSKTGVTLTESGKIVVEEGEKILRIYDTLIERLAALDHHCHAEPSGKIRLMVTTICDHKIFQQFIPIFNKDYPNINLEIQVSNRLMVENAVQSDLVDLGFAQFVFQGDEELPNTMVYHYIPLIKEGFHVIVHKSSPFYHKDCLYLQDIFDEPILLFNNSGGQQSRLADWLNQHGKINDIIGTGTFPHYTKLILSKKNLSITTKRTYDGLCRDNLLVQTDYRLIPFGETLTQQIFGFYKKNKGLLLSEQVFLEQVQLYTSQP